MDDETVQAIETVARRVLFVLVDTEYYGADVWEDFPEIGEHDWDRVVDQARALVGGLNPSGSLYADAYAHLKSRATDEEA